MFTFSEGRLWAVRVHTGRFNLYITVPLYVLGDLLTSLEDLCEVILPRLGLPNYAAVLRELLRALTDLPADMPLIDLHNDEIELTCKQITWGGN